MVLAYMGQVRTTAREGDQAIDGGTAMIWLTWRQFRAQTIVTAAFLAVLAVVLLVTGLSLVHVYDSSGLAACHGSRCAAFANNFINEVKGGISEKVFYAGIYIVYAAPAIIGVFWGAPLIAREIEAGTFRLAWNQSVSRSRWVAVKLGLIGLAAMVTAELLVLMMNWWASPVYSAVSAARSDSLSIARIAPTLFGAQGIVPIGYAAFAFTLRRHRRAADPPHHPGYGGHAGRLRLSSSSPGRTGCDRT